MDLSNLRPADGAKQSNNFRRGRGPVSYTHLDVYKRQTRYIKRGGKVWIKIFPDKPVTTKPAETRMGSGKGTMCFNGFVHIITTGFELVFACCILYNFTLFHTLNKPVVNA